MDQPRIQIGWRATAMWYLAVIAVCFVGAFFAYNGRLSSDAWRTWSSPAAWKRDLLRAIVGAILALFLLWNFRVLSSKPDPLRRDLADIHLRRYEWIVVWTMIVLVIASATVLLPLRFRWELSNRHSRVPTTFDQIWKPYIPYVLYMFGLWIGIMTPIFLVILRIVPQDWKSWLEASARLDQVSTTIPTSESDGISNFAARLTLAFQDYAVILKRIVERYIPVPLVMSVYLLYEQRTTSYQTVTDLAVELGKFASWILLGPALIISLSTVAVGYEKAVQKTEAGLRGLITASLDATQDRQFLSGLFKARDDVIWSRSPGEFVFSIVKSATLSIPLLLAITVYVLRTVGGPEGWVNVFVPHAIVTFFKGLFR